MENAKQTETITLPRRKVICIAKVYYVAQYFDTCGWTSDGRGYPHSTSAYAKLGRLVNADTTPQWADRFNLPQ